MAATICPTNTLTMDSQGLEPRTHWLWVSCSNLLSYKSWNENLYSTSELLCYKYAHLESNQDLRFRRPLHYPLCYGRVWTKLWLIEIDSKVFINLKSQFYIQINFWKTLKNVKKFFNATSFNNINSLINYISEIKKYTIETNEIEFVL